MAWDSKPAYMYRTHSKCEVCGKILGETYYQDGVDMCYTCWSRAQDNRLLDRLARQCSFTPPTNASPSPILTENDIRKDAVYEVKRGDNSLGRTSYSECPYCGHLLKECGCGFSWTPLGRARARQGER